MKNIINQIFNRKLFIKVGKSVIYIDLLFASFLFVITIAGIGVLNAVKYGFQYSLFEFFFFIPLIVLAALFISKWHNPKTDWNQLDKWSKLDYLKGLKTPSISQTYMMKELGNEFYNYFGITIENLKSKWHNKYQPFLLFVVMIILYFIFKLI